MAPTNQSFITLYNNRTYLSTILFECKAIEQFRVYINPELPSCEPVKGRDDRQGIAIVVEHTPATKAACHRGLPPEYALTPVVRCAQNQPMHLVEKLPLPLGRFRKGRRLALIFGGPPVVRHFRDDVLSETYRP